MFNFKICFGSRRIVFLLNDRAYKIPNFLAHYWSSFLAGFLENLHERYWWSSDGSRKRGYKTWSQPHLAEIFWADRFGFLVIMQRADCSVTDTTPGYAEFADKHSRMFKDCAPRNVGFHNGQIVLVDYGFYGGNRDCYLGT